MKEFTYTITDEQGIHARPAGLLVKEAAGFASAITIEKDGKKVDAKRILGVMGLGAKKGAEITLRAEGEDEDAAIEKLRDLSLMISGRSFYDDLYYFKIP